MDARGRLLRCHRVPGSVLIALLLAMPACGSSTDRSATQTPGDGITVAAASDLRPAFEAIGSNFEASTNINVTFSFGSSGQLREQIINGAPFDVYASANVEYVDDVIESGLGVASSKSRFANGRIALLARPGVALPEKILDLSEARYQRVAIANPIHAPYGEAGMQALRSAGIAAQVEPKMTFAANVGDALRITRSGNADVGVVALSLAIASKEAFRSVPADLHKPIKQALVVTSRGSNGTAANAFAEYVQSEAGRKVLTRYGYETPTNGGATQGTATHE